MVTIALSLSSTGGIKAETNKGILRVLLNIQNTGLVFGKQRKGNKRSGCCLFPSDSRTLNKSFTLDGLLAPKRGWGEPVVSSSNSSRSVSPEVSLTSHCLQLQTLSPGYAGPALCLSADFHSPSCSKSPTHLTHNSPPPPRHC